MDSPYYLLPNDQVGQEAFAVIREAMRGKGPRLAMPEKPLDATTTLTLGDPAARRAKRSKAT